MTSSKFRTALSCFVYFFLGFCIIMLQTSGLLSLNIGKYSPVLAVPLTVYAGFYFRETVGACLGFFFGAVLDSCSSTLCYNTCFCLVCGFLCGLLLREFLNSNLAAATVLSIVSSAIYFSLKWLVVYAFNDPDPLPLLTNVMSLSAVYTALFSIVLYFIINPFLKKIALRPRH